MPTPSATRYFPDSKGRPINLVRGDDASNPTTEDGSLRVGEAGSIYSLDGVDDHADVQGLPLNAGADMSGLIMVDGLVLAALDGRVASTGLGATGFHLGLYGVGDPKEGQLFASIAGASDSALVESTQTYTADSFVVLWRLGSLNGVRTLSIRTDTEDWIHTPVPTLGVVADSPWRLGCPADVAGPSHKLTVTRFDLWAYALDLSVFSSVIPEVQAGLPTQAQKEAAFFKDLALPSGDVGVERFGDEYRLLAPLAAGLTWAINLTKVNGGANGADEVRQLGSSTTAITTGHQNDDAAVYTDGSFNWGTAPSGNALAHEGTYRRTDVPGSCVWTSPPATVVGCHHLKVTNGAYSIVAIDGDRTLATSLPTAQEEVDAGRLATTSLVANGGAMNPTDRVISHFKSSGNWDEVTILAVGLELVAHTVELIWTGYPEVGATGDRTYVSGWFYGPSVDGEFVDLDPINAAYSAWEYANTFRPEGQLTSEWFGNVHGYEVENSLDFVLDAVALDLADGERAWGSSLVITRTTTATHPESVGTTADVTTTYTLDSEGLRVRTVTVWNEPGTVHNSYAAMHPVVNDLNRATIVGEYSSEGLDFDDGRFVGHIESGTVVLWAEGGNVASGLTVNNLDEAVNSWALAAPRYTMVQDRDGAGLNKIYVTRIGSGGSPETVAAGDVWVFDVTHRAAWLDEPDAVLVAN